MKYLICTILIWGVGINYTTFGMGYILHFTITHSENAHWFPLAVVAWVFGFFPMVGWISWLDNVRSDPAASPDG